MINIIITRDGKHYEYNDNNYYSYELDERKFAVILEDNSLVVKEIIGFGKIEDNAIVHGRAYKLLKNDWDF